MTAEKRALLQLTLEEAKAKYWEALDCNRLLPVGSPEWEARTDYVIDLYARVGELIRKQQEEGYVGT